MIARPSAICPSSTPASEAARATAARAPAASTKDACSASAPRQVTSNRLLDNRERPLYSRGKRSIAGMHHDESKQREGAWLSGTGVRP